MKSLLVGAGFTLRDVQDSTEESQSFFERMAAQMAKTGSPPVAWRLFLGDDFPAMALNQVRNATNGGSEPSASFASRDRHARPAV